MTLDAIDQRILTVLQRDGRCPNNQLAAEVGLSPSPCLRRVRLLEEAGVIERYAAIVDPAKVGMGMTVFARVWLTGQDEDQVERFVAAVRQLTQIVECHLMAGDCDFLLRIVAPTSKAFAASRLNISLASRACVASRPTYPCSGSNSRLKCR